MMKRWIRQTLREAAWAPTLVLCLFAVAAGFDVYDAFPSLDMPTHFVGGVAATYFFQRGLVRFDAAAGRRPYPVQAVLALGLTAITAVCWEFLEYLSDLFLGTKMNFGVADTLSDLFFGLLGGLVFVFFSVRSGKKRALRGGA